VQWKVDYDDLWIFAWRLAGFWLAKTALELEFLFAALRSVNFILTGIYLVKYGI
jgi:hypothetical protein